MMLFFFAGPNTDLLLSLLSFALISNGLEFYGCNLMMADDCYKNLDKAEEIFKLC